tara:strand:- start:320 stop:670 length:351 start_codon:yes stop_codon:yes gene_type:complete
MKKLLIVLLCLFSFNTLTYASFPITENYTETLEILSLEEDDDGDDEPSLIEIILGGILFLLIPAFGSYFLIRAWWRAWKDYVKWVKILTYILLVPVLLMLLLGFILAISGFSLSTM